MRTNPFATRFVAPGVLPWITDPKSSDQSVDAIVKRLQQSAGGAIIGPHGSGKSTLLAHIIPRLGSVLLLRDPNAQVIQAGLRQNENNIVWLQCRQSCRQSCKIPWSAMNQGDVLVIDGFEQLSLIQRAFCVAKTRWTGVKILVTSHCRQLLIPTICSLTVSPELALQVISTLSPQIQDRLSLTDISTRLVQHRGNLRELLMELYDEFEDQNGRL